MTTNTREMIIDTEEMYIINPDLLLEMYIINPDLLLNFHKWQQIITVTHTFLDIEKLANSAVNEVSIPPIKMMVDTINYNYIKIYYFMKDQLCYMMSISIAMHCCPKSYYWMNTELRIHRCVAPNPPLFNSTNS